MPNSHRGSLVHTPHFAPRHFENAAIPSAARPLFYTASSRQRFQRRLPDSYPARLTGCVSGARAGRRCKKFLSSLARGLIWWLGLWAVMASAQAGPTRYVTDEFTITLRSGAGNQYRILQLLPTGTSVEVVETDSGWTRVETAKGRQGWVSSQYLISRPPAAQRLEQVSTKLAQLQAQDGQLEQRMEQTQQQLVQARERVNKLTSARDRLIRQLDESREGLQLANENKQLKKQIIDLKRRLQDLANETERLSDRSRQDWFLVGAAVLFAGMLVGITVTRIRWRRRSSWGDL